MAMKSLGYTPEKTLDTCDGPCICGCCSECKPSFPTMYVNSKQMPEIDEWDIGESYDITVTVRMRNRSEYEKSKEGSSADLVVEAYDAKSKKSLS